MLTVVPIKSSSVSKGYYLQQDGGYYIENQEDKTLYQWYGEGADKLGLNDSIDLKVHTEVFSGNLPNGVQIGKRSADGVYQGRPGYDLTFSLNKDLSLIICCSENKALSDYFLQAHISSVKTALNQIEKNTQAKITVDGKTEFQYTKNMIAALCTHFSSRAGDPDIHTHALIANATERSDGNWRALATDMSRQHGFFEMVRDNAVFFGSIYQNEMARATKKMGFSVEPIYKNGLFRIRGFSDDIRDHFSKRRKQIEEIVDALSPNIKINKNLYEQIAKHSKADKEVMGSKEFIKKSKNSMNEFLQHTHTVKGFDDLIDQCKLSIKIKPFSNANNNKKSAEILRDAIDHQLQFQNSLKINQIILKAMSFSIGECSYQDYTKNILELIKSGYLIRNGDGYTTEQSMCKEENLTNLVFKTLPKGMRAQITTPPDQKNMRKTLMDSLSQSRLCVISEPKNLEDKENLLSHLIADLKAQHKSVTLLAANKMIGNHYNGSICSKDESIWKRLKNIAKDDLAKGIHSFLFHYENEIKMPLNNLFSKNGKEVFIVDDAKRLSFDVVQKLLSLTEKRQANIIFLKNNEGKSNLFTGNPFEVIEKIGINKIETSKIYQQSKINIKAQVTIETTNANTLDKQNSRQMQSAKTIANELCLNNEATLVLSSSKKSAEKLNQLIRDELIAMNKIDGKQHSIKISESLYLTEQAQKYAASYPMNVLIKEYVGKGQYRIRKILRQDVDKNQIIVEGIFGRPTVISANKMAKSIKSGEIQICREKELKIATGDIIRLIKNNKQSDALHLSLGKLYRITSLDEKHIYLNNQSENTKSIRIKKSRLNGLSLAYGYARSVNEPIAEKNIGKIICDLPSRAINKTLISDLSRHTNHIHVVTDAAVNFLKNIPAKMQKIPINNADNTASIDANKIEAMLKQHAPVITEKTLGPPNEALSNQHEWHYGRRGELVVHVQGKNQGSFHNKRTGEAGDMTTLLMRSMGVSNQDALTYATGILKQGLPTVEHTKLTIGHESSVQKLSPMPEKELL